MEAVPPSAINRFGKNPPGHRAVDIDVFLPGLAGGRDLPAEQMRRRVFFERPPGSHSLRRGCAGGTILPAPQAWCRRANDHAGVCDAAAI